jgi:hypothetical protein
VAVETTHIVKESLDESEYFDATEESVDESMNFNRQEDHFLDDWNNTCDAIMKNPESCPHQKHLEVFLSRMEELQAVQASLEQIFQEVHASLSSILEKSLACAVPVHEIICSKMTDVESDLLSLFQRNHGLRRDLLQSLEDFNDTWQKKYTNFTSRVILESNAEALSKESLCSSVEELKTISTSVENKGQEGFRAQPDWESIVELNPSSRSSIETFLDGVSDWNAACDEFGSCFDEIRQTIEISHAKMLKILSSASVQISDELASVQIDIQEHIISNTRRREQIEQALQQVVQQQQTIFSRLMARVGGKSVKINKGPASETSKGNCLRAMIPFANVFSQNN